MPLIVSDFGVRLPDSLVNNGWVINIQQPAQEPTVAGEKIEFSPPQLGRSGPEQSRGPYRHSGARRSVSGSEAL